MWIMTTLGFYSVVSPRTDRNQPDSQPDPNRVMIRARAKSHLTALIDNFPEELGMCELMTTLMTDYRYRIICPKAAWVRCLTVLAQEQSYSNFKDTCETIHGKKSPYLHALHQTWGDMLDIQDEN